MGFVVVALLASAVGCADQWSACCSGRPRAPDQAPVLPTWWPRTAAAVQPTSLGQGPRYRTWHCSWPRGAATRTPAPAGVAAPSGNETPCGPRGAAPMLVPDRVCPWGDASAARVFDSLLSGTGRVVPRGARPIRPCAGAGLPRSPVGAASGWPLTSPWFRQAGGAGSRSRRDFAAPLPRAAGAQPACASSWSDLAAGRPVCLSG